MLPMPEPSHSGHYTGPIVSLALSGFTFAMTVAQAAHSHAALIAAVGSLCVGVGTVGRLGFDLYLYQRHGRMPNRKGDAK